MAQNKPERNTHESVPKNVHHDGTPRRGLVKPLVDGSVQ